MLWYDESRAVVLYCVVLVVTSRDRYSIDRVLWYGEGRAVVLYCVVLVVSSIDMCCGMVKVEL